MVPFSVAESFSVLEASEAGGVTFTAINRCDTDIEVEYFRHGGIPHYVLRDYLSQSPVAA